MIPPITPVVATYFRRDSYHQLHRSRRGQIIGVCPFCNESMTSVPFFEGEPGQKHAVEICPLCEEIVYDPMARSNPRIKEEL